MSGGIGEFLKSRRARIQPADVGLPDLGRRRVPGLRREELAQLAGVSIDYYTRLERCRARNVSDAILDAIADVLRLDATEREHLRHLARPSGPAAARRGAGAAGGRERVRPGLLRLLEMMDAVPACVLGRRTDVLAYNALADALYGFGDMPAEHRNAARHTFLHPGVEHFYADWHTVAEEAVAFLHLDVGRHPHDRRLAALIGELSMHSDTFRTLWAAHPVQDKTYGTKHICHPVVGDLELAYETLLLPGDLDQCLVLYTAPAGSPTEDRLRLLASWQATEMQHTQTPVPRPSGDCK
ncbi:helix-turn-helix domain-containing protein [Streptomyces sp. PSKA01]|uniref:Helix-turn-helix domain-containing protein n=2 Tax=Streptomyces cupreus TaxID=2759956 RepID=A0A7X1J6N9_9ACTN|nr:helix-turn-helix domain-containing protein [Streptomyces cupreus]